MGSLSDVVEMGRMVRSQAECGREFGLLIIYIYIFLTQPVLDLSPFSKDLNTILLTLNFKIIIILLRPKFKCL